MAPNVLNISRENVFSLTNPLCVFVDRECVNEHGPNF